MKARQVLLFALLLVVGSTPALSFLHVGAASFDGTYDYAYNLNGPSGWETHHVEAGFIVRNGRISSNPSALSGTVDSGGNVVFTGPSPYGGGSATFTGVIRSDGSGDGTYRDAQGLGGRWSVSRVSGGSGLTGIVDAMLSAMYSLSFIGEAVGLSGTTAAAAGTAAVIFAFVMVVSVLTTVGSGRRRGASRGDRGRDPRSKVDFEYGRRGEYEFSQPEAPPGVHETSASSIGVPPPPVSPPVGLGVAPSGLPERLVLSASWGGGRVNLAWERPEFDPGRYELMGYEVVEMRYDGTSTASGRRVVGRPPPGSTGWGGGFEQTFRWSTGGDLEGYRVDALFRELGGDGPPRVLRVGSTAYAPLS